MKGLPATFGNKKKNKKIKKKTTIADEETTFEIFDFLAFIRATDRACDFGGEIRIRSFK